MEKQTVEQSFLGTGWAFPPTFNPANLNVELVSEEQDIEESLYILISTLPGERLLKPKYGCDLHSLVFDQISFALQQEIIHLVGMAILRYEPRIDVEEIQVNISPESYGLLYILVEYTIRQTNSRSNIVYPFYLREGTNVKEV